MFQDSEGSNKVDKIWQDFILLCSYSFSNTASAEVQ